MMRRLLLLLLPLVCVVCLTTGGYLSLCWSVCLLACLPVFLTVWLIMYFFMQSDQGTKSKYGVVISTIKYTKYYERQLYTDSSSVIEVVLCNDK